MQVEQEEKVQYTYTIDKTSGQFSYLLHEILRQSNGMDELFLSRINDILKGRNIIEAHQISDLSLILSLSVQSSNLSHTKQTQTQFQQKKYKSVEQLQKVILQAKRPNKQKMQCLELMGWVSEIWDKILHFSCYKNHLDLLVLYYFIGQFLFQPEAEFKRLLNLLLQSVSKLKIIPFKTLEIILHLLTFFGQANQMKILSTESKSQLKLITVLYLAKMNDPTASELKYFREKLEEIKCHQIHILMECIQKIQEGGHYYQQVIWDKLFTSLLNCYSKYDILKEITLKIIIQMVSFRLDLQTMKLLVRQLEISNELKPLKKWKEIFQIMSLALRIYDAPKECLSFSSSKSYIKYPLNFPQGFLIEVQIKTSSKISNQQKMLFMLQDKHRKQQIWIALRQCQQSEVIIMILKVSNGIINEQEKLAAKWFIYNINLVTIMVSNNFITLQLNGSSAKMQLFNSSTNFMNFVVGDEDGSFGTSIKSLYAISIYNSNQKQNGVCHKMEVNGKACKGIRKQYLPSFVEIVRNVGDLDIFLMIISHAIKKLKKNKDIVLMIREALTLLEKFVEVKRVKQIKVTQAERQKRLNAILCLCWQCSHQTNNALAVLELLRFLTIRGVSNPDDELEILCNFVFWKQFQWQYQKLMIMKIKELFSEIRIKENNHKIIKKYCQRILQETALYYRQEQHIDEGVSEKDNLLKIHYQFLALVKDQLAYILNDKKNLQDYYDFIEFTIKLLFWTLSRKNTIIDAFDLTLSVQLSIFVRWLGENLKEWTGKDEKILKITKEIIDIVGVYQCQSPFYEDKKIKIYMENRGFIHYDDKVIKENLYFLAYSLASLKNNILYSIIQSDQNGINEISCIVWQKRIIQPLILAMDKSSLYRLSTDKLSEVKYLYERLSLKSLSYDQNKNLLTIYLNNDNFFNERDYRLTQHFCKILNIKDLLDLMFYSLRRHNKSQLQQTTTSKISIQSVYQKDQLLKKQKILSLLGSCDELTSEQGFMILQQLEAHYDSKQPRLNFMIQHFALKGLVQKTLQIIQNSKSANSFLSTLSQVHTSMIEKQSIQLTLDLGSLINCLEYYLNIITVQDLLSYNGITNTQEAQCHLENYRINIEGVMNNLGSTEINTIYKLKNYHYFLEKQLLPLSKYYLQKQNFKPIVENKYNGARLRKGSKEQLQFPKHDLKQQSKNMYLEFLDERNFNLLKVEQVWLEVQERNKSFWSTFIGKEFYYSLYDGTGNMHQRYLLKKDSKKPKLQLPKMILKGSCHRSASASVISQRFEFNNDEQSNSSIFDDAHLYRKQPVSCLNLTNYQELTKQNHKSNIFRVLLITVSKIYQGSITVGQKKLIFKENQKINNDLYEKIFAAQCEKRLEDQCIKQNYCFQEEISEKCTAIVKRYLFHDIGIEIHTNNRSHFMVFNKKDQRQAFIYLVQKHMKVLTRQKLAQETKCWTQKWQNGLISNYQYLMKLNDLTGRSLNDMSQYYIFPWTVTNFDDQIDASFFCKPENFRDLSLPIGKLNKNKWQDIKRKYEMNKQMRNSQMQIPTFLYGSFYSNRAIVCNYLIRVSPFSGQHYELQSQQFDAADRLFYSITDSYKSLSKCPADFKELIPEFYYFPHFLKNRCAYNLGQRQNKDIVHDVIIPKWSLDEYEFIFRMRKILQCEIVSINLNNWIDLVLGVYANKKYALKADNLFMSDLYIEGYEKYLLEKDKTSIQLFKEFGQVPVPIIHSNHTSIKFKSNFIDSILHPTIKIEEYIPAKIHECGKVIQIYYYKRFTFLLFQKQIRMFQQDKFSDRDYVSVNGDFQGGTLRVWELFDIDNKKHHCIIVHKMKNSELIGFEIKKNLFKYSIQHGDTLPFKNKTNLVSIFDNYIFCAEDKNIYIFKNIQEEADQEYSTHNFSLICYIGKTKYLLSLFGQFTHHKSRILFLKSNDRGMIISIDEENKCFITQVSNNKASIFNFFQIKCTYFEEKIIEVHIHNMGFIVMRTDYDRLIVYSFLGDLILSEHLNFQPNARGSTEKPLNVSIWNHELSEILIGTNLGNLWKIDIFELRKRKKIKEGGIWMQKLYLNKSGFRKEALLKTSVNRIGRHWITLVYAQNSKIYSLKSQKWQQAKKVEIFKKKVTNFW